LYRWLEQARMHIDISAVKREYPGVMTFERWLHSQFQLA
jgi:hypothetical protein